MGGSTLRRAFVRHACTVVRVDLAERLCRVVIVAVSFRHADCRVFMSACLTVWCGAFCSGVLKSQCYFFSKCKDRATSNSLRFICSCSYNCCALYARQPLPLLYASVTRACACVCVRPYLAHVLSSTYAVAVSRRHADAVSSGHAVCRVLMAPCCAFFSVNVRIVRDCKSVRKRSLYFRSIDRDDFLQVLHSSHFCVSRGVGRRCSVLL